MRITDGIGSITVCEGFAFGRRRVSILDLCEMILREAVIDTRRGGKAGCHIKGDDRLFTDVIGKLIQRVEARRSASQSKT